MGIYEITTEGGVYLVTTEDPPAPTSLRNEALGVGNRLMEGVGSLVSLGAAANRNLNPFAPGGPQLFGLNKNPINSFFEQQEEQAKAEVETLARQLLLYGDEKAQTAAGKIAEEIAFNAPGVLIPGGTVIQRVASGLSAGLASGVGKAAGASEDTQALLGLGGALLPGAAQGSASKLLNAVGVTERALDWAARLKRQALGAKTSDFTKAARQDRLVNNGETVETSLMRAFESLDEEGMLRGSLDPVEIYKRASTRSSELSKELGSIIDEADAVRVANQADRPVKPMYEMAEKFIASAPADERRSLRSQLAKWIESVETEGDGSLRFLQDQKEALYAKAYPEGQKSVEGLDRAIASDLRRTIEDETANLLPTAAGKVRGLNKRIGAFEQTEPILKRELAKAEGANLLQRSINFLKTTGGAGVPLILGLTGAGVGGLTGVGAGVAGIFHLLGTPTGQRKLASFLNSLPDDASLLKNGSSLGASAIRLPAAIEPSSTYPGDREAQTEGALQRTKRSETSPWNAPISTSTGARLEEADRKEDKKDTARDSELSASASQSADEPEQPLDRSPARSAFATDRGSRLAGARSNRQILSANPENGPSTTSPTFQRDALSNPAATQTSEWEDLLRPGSLSRSAALDLFSRGENMSEESSQNLDPLIRAVIQQESGGNPKARSEVGAVGLMQLMPATAKEIAGELGYQDYDLEDPETNRRFGTYYLEKLLRQFDGDVELALTAYHSGPGRVQKLLERTGGRTLADIIDLLGPVGQKYARSVLRRMERGVTQV